MAADWQQAPQRPEPEPEAATPPGGGDPPPPGATPPGDDDLPPPGTTPPGDDDLRPPGATPPGGDDLRPPGATPPGGDDLPPPGTTPPGDVVAPRRDDAFRRAAPPELALGGAEPTRRLAGGARLVWAVHQIVIWGVATAIGVTIASHVSGRFAPLLWALPALVLLVTATVIPALRWSRWRWDVRADGIDIRHGTFEVRRTLVPWIRVQHVDTRRGVLEQLLGLSTVVVHTAAGSHTIPHLARADADGLRDRIAALARTEDA